MSDLQHQIVQLEMTASRLYELYATLFAEDKGFWEKLSKEEVIHAEVVSELDFSSGSVPKRLLSLLVTDIQSQIKTIESKIDLFSHTAPEKLHAYEQALFIETYAAEKLVIDFIVQKSEADNIISDCTDHYSAIHKQIENIILHLPRNYNSLFLISISLEVLAEEFYKRLWLKFHSNKKAAEFFKSMQHEEVIHQVEIEKIFKELPTEVLLDKHNFSNVNSSYLQATSIVNREVNRISHLGEAIELCHILENLETNLIFNFFITSFIKEKDRRKLLSLQLQNHNNNLISFSQKAERFF